MTKLKRISKSALIANGATKEFKFKIGQGKFVQKIIFENDNNINADGEYYTISVQTVPLEGLGTPIVAGVELFEQQLSADDGYISLSRREYTLYNLELIESDYIYVAIKQSIGGNSNIGVRVLYTDDELDIILS